MARLNIPDEPTFQTFTVTTAQTVFPFDFAVFAKADLNVTVDGTLLDQSAFILSGPMADGGGYQGGTVTLNTAVTSAEVVIYRGVVPARASQYAPANTVPVGAVDQALNRLTANVQDLQRDVDRAVKVAIGDDAISPSDVLTAAQAVANKVDVDAGNLATDAQRAAFKAGAQIVPFKTGPTTPVPGSRFSADHVLQIGNQDGTYQGGQWTGATKAGLVISKEYTSADTATSEVPAPAVLLTAFANGTTITYDVLPLQLIATAMTNASCVFGLNVISANTLSSLTGVKQVVAEFDQQWATGSTPSGLSGGIFGTTFGAPNAGNALYLFGHGGGTWSNAIKLAGINATVGAGLSLDPGQTIGSLVNSTVGSFATAALELGTGTGPGLRLHGPTGDGSDAARIFNSGGFLVLRKGPQPLVVQNQAGSSTIFSVDDVGAQAVGVNAALGSAFTQHVAGFDNTEGGSIAKHTAANNTLSVSTFIATGTNGNAAAAAMRLRANASTSRSINAGGTINASGADYAEYERLNNTAQASVVRPGDVIGFDAAGEITLRFDEAISFGVKSTHPNLVGGDNWHEGVGEPPERPVFEPCPMTAPSNPGDEVPPEVTAEEVAAEFDAVGPALVAFMANQRTEWAKKGLTSDQIAALEASSELEATTRARLISKIDRKASMVGARDAYFEAWAAWWSAADACEASEVERKAAFEAGPMADWQAEQAAFEDRLNAERKKWDRIAYCGKVPVNVTDATPGQYLIPAMRDDGGISVRIVDPADMTVPDMLSRLGRVRRVLDDGRAEIVVAVG